jgi:hypothetical protein
MSSIIEPILQHNNNVKNIMFDICKNEFVDDAGTVAVIVWCLWYNRNNGV